MNHEQDWPHWERLFESFLRDQLERPDPAHDLAHIRRVVSTAKQLTGAEKAEPQIVYPAAWLHDCVMVPKDSPLRSKASVEAAKVALGFLREQGYPSELLDDVFHAIEAHSFSANIPPRTLEAKVVQDADRLDAIGAIGIARCFVTAGLLGSQLYHQDEPFPVDRIVDDKHYAVDHFYAKLLKLRDTMQTDAGREEAERRTQFMLGYLNQMRFEIG
ncbi:MAG: HD domain-containing protein [Gemmataceae bacterium]